jgi:ABC-type lipoprotein export system ATPase subunit/ABC-type antimicrobial peptide transport system permease subunit
MSTSNSDECTNDSPTQSGAGSMGDTEALSDSDESNSALRIRSVCKDYQLGSESVRVLKGIDLVVPAGDFVAIMGPSGSGKSTLLNLLGCLDQPTSGEYHIGDQDVAKLSDDELALIRAERIGFVFQAYNLVQQLTVLENIEAPLAYGLGMTDEDRQHCRDLATQVGLADRINHRPNELSGGQQQRAGIARSLANRPRFILADEATGNLDTATTNEILDLFDQLNQSGTTIVMVTHEEEVAQRARRIVRLRDGVIESDTRSRPVENKPSEENPSPDSSGPGTRYASSRPVKKSRRLVMRLRDIRVGLKSLLLHPLRSLLTVLGIFIGVASVIWLLAIGEGIAGKAQQQIEELGANNIILTTSRPPTEQLRERKIYFYGLTDEDCRHLELTISSIDLAIPFCRRNQLEIRHRARLTRGEVNACTPEYKELYSLELARGRFITDADVEEKAKVCVLAQEIADELFQHEDALHQSVRIVHDFYRVVGIIRPRGDIESVRGTTRSQDFTDNVYIPIETFWSRFGDSYSTGNNGGRGVSQITLRLKDKNDALATGQAVTQALQMTHPYDDYTVGIPMELLEQARNTRLMFMAMMGLIAAISLLVGGIGIMNIMLATVTERTREIGIRRALGARRKDITRQFVIETVLLSVAGGITGILGGLTCGRMIEALRWSVTQLIPDVMKSLPETVQTVVPIVLPWSIPLAFGISVTVGVVFGLYPARRAATMNPIDALRHVA